MTETFNYKDIREEYGIETIQKIRRFESISRTKGRYTSHLRFYLHCKHGGITPRGIKVKSQMKGNEARKIIEKTEKALLNIRIGEVARKNQVLDRRKEEIVKELEDILPERINEKIKEINEERENKEMKKSSETQRKKYQRLKEHKEKGQKVNITSLNAEPTIDTNVNKTNNPLRKNNNTEIQEIQDGGSTQLEDEENSVEEENEEVVLENDENEEEEDTNDDDEDDQDRTIAYAEEEHEPKNVAESIKERWV